MPFQAADFESAASTIPPYRHVEGYVPEGKGNGKGAYKKNA